MISTRGLRIPLAFLLSSLAVVASSWAQSVAIVRPSIISKESHELFIDPSLAGFHIGDNFEKAIKKIGRFRVLSGYLLHIVVVLEKTPSRKKSPVVGPVGAVGIAKRFPRAGGIPKEFHGIGSFHRA